MSKFLGLCLAILLLGGCTNQDETYYRLHPKALEAALKNCPNASGSKLSCDALKAIATNLNELAYSMQANPQRFGKNILSLQQELAKQQSAVKNKPDPELEKKIDQNKLQLVKFLAVVKWLQSPES